MTNGALPLSSALDSETEQKSARKTGTSQSSLSNDQIQGQGQGQGRGRGRGRPGLAAINREQVKNRGSAAATAGKIDGDGRHLPNGRLPQAPASLLVQLPRDEMQRFSPGPSREDVDNIREEDLATLALSDIEVLARSVVARRRRDAQVFAWQRRLIEGDDDHARLGTVSRSSLKRALCHLSCTSWLQVLQERHLADRCAYPTCSKRPKRPPLSSASTSLLPMDAPRYRISLAKRTISRDDRDDAGGENGYCGKTCWRRGEWIRRWILSEAGSVGIGDPVQSQAAAISASASANSSSSRAGVQSLNPNMGQWISSKADAAPVLDGAIGGGGRWEEMIRQVKESGTGGCQEEDEVSRHAIDLMEDMEDRGEVDRLSDDEKGSKDDDLRPGSLQPSCSFPSSSSSSFPSRSSPSRSSPSPRSKGSAVAPAVSPSPTLQSLEMVRQRLGDRCYRAPHTALPASLAAKDERRSQEGFQSTATEQKHLQAGTRPKHEAKSNSRSRPEPIDLRTLLDSLTIHEHFAGKKVTLPRSPHAVTANAQRTETMMKSEERLEFAQPGAKDNDNEEDDSSSSKEELALRAEVDLMFELGMEAMQREKENGTWQE